MERFFIDFIDKNLNLKAGIVLQIVGQNQIYIRDLPQGISLRDGIGIPVIVEDSTLDIFFL